MSLFRLEPRDASTREPLPREFFARGTLAVARELLGCVLAHETAEGRAAGRIVEVEAYCGIRDRGAHSFGGRRTARNEVMYGPPGFAYVYFTYGMHFCVNAVTREAGIAQAVLIRALAPLEGEALMRRRRGVDGAVPPIPDTRLCRGPGNLCRALAIERAQNGADLTRSGLRIEAGEPIPRSHIRRSPRIGIAYAGPDALRPWRFYVEDEPSVSGPRSVRACENLRAR